MKTRIHTISDETPRKPMNLRRLALPAFVPLLAVVLLAASSSALRAQRVSFAGRQSTVAHISVPYNPYAAAMDGAGDIFIISPSPGAAAVGKIPADGGPQTPVGSGWSDVFAIAADRAGDVFVSDVAFGGIIEVTVGGVQTKLLDNGQRSTGVAVDGAGNVFALQSGQVVKLPWTGSGYGTPMTFPVSGLGLSSFYGSMAVDAKGDIFAVDASSNRVMEAPWTGSGYSTAVAVGTGLNYPAGVAVDGVGNVFITDQATSASTHSQVVEVPANGGDQIVVSTKPFPFLPQAIAVDGSGNVFFTDFADFTVQEVQLHSVNFGSVNICPVGQGSPVPCSVTIPLTYNITADGTLGTPQVLAEGAANHDFTLAAGSTCTGAVTAGTSCTVNVTFAPQYAGLSSGAVEIVDGSGNVIASTPIYGTGEGPQIAFDPGTPATVLNPGVVAYPTGAAVDGAGNTYIVNPDPNTVVKVAPDGSRTVISIPGAVNIWSIAADGGGNLYVSDVSADLIWKITPAGVQTTLPTNGLSIPDGIAVDGAGNVFIADTGNNRVVEISPNGAQTTVPATGLNGPWSVAVDGAGNVFIADRNNNRVVKVTPAGVQTTIATVDIPWDVKVDAAGNVFIAALSEHAVLEVSPSGVQTSLPVSRITTPLALALDAAGGLIVTDGNGGAVVKDIRSQAPSLSFAATNAGESSSDSPQSVTVENIGNQALNAIAPGLQFSDANFIETAGTGTPEDCTAGFTLTPGTGCNLSISFTPTTGGPITSAAVLTDNALNGNPATQSITLTGTGISVSPTLSFTVPNQTYGAAPFAVSATSNSTGAITYSVVSGPAAISGSLVTIIGTGTVTLRASQAAAAGYAAATSTASFSVNQAVLTVTAANASRAYGASNPAFTYNVGGFVNGDPSSVVSGTATLSTTATSTSVPGSYPISFSTQGLTAANYSFTYIPATLTVTQATQTITFNALPNVTYGAGPITLTATASSGLPVTYTVTGPATLSGSTLTITGAGTVGVTATQIGNASYSPATAVTRTFTVNKATQTLSFTVPNQTYGAAPFPVQATSTSAGAITYSVVSGPATISSNIVTLTGVGTVTLLASQAATANFTAGSIQAAFTVAGPPVITINNGNTSLNFGVFPFGLTGTNQITFGVTISNNTPNTTRISAALVNSPSNFSIIQNGCGAPQSGYGSYCQITIGFTQPATLAGLAQTYAASLVLTSSNPSFGFVGGNGTVALTAGSAKVYTNAPYGTTAATPYDFGSTSNGSTGSSLNFQIFNPSGWNNSGAPAPVTLNNYNNWNRGGSCNGYLSDKSQCAMTLQFKGSYPPGQTNSGTLTIGNTSGIRVWNADGTAIFGTLYLTGRTN